MARLNDTIGLSSRGAGGGESHTVSTRKIDNGYLVCRESYNSGTGECHRTEMFSRGKPEISPAKIRGAAGQMADSRNALADANACLKGR